MSLKIEHYDEDGNLKTSGSGGGAPVDATYITQTPNANLTNEQALSALATGVMVSTTGTGVVSTEAQLTHERGGLEADVSAYNGLIRISGGATSNLTLPLILEYGGTEADLSATGPGALVQTGAGNAVTVETLDETRGGTAQTTYATGDMLHATGANTLGKLAVGSDGYVIVADAGETGSMSYEPLPFVCNGRLTLTSATPVLTSDVTGASTIYFALYKGNRIAIYDGTRWQWYEFAERSVAVPATTNTPFDIFIYDNAGTLTLVTTDWTNDTTRATALTTQDGVYVQSGATNRRYLGTGRTTGVSGETEFQITNRSSMLLWNYYNRVRFEFEVFDTTDNWSYSGNYRYLNNSSTNIFKFVTGVQEDAVEATHNGAAYSATAPGSAARLSIGLDSGTAPSANALNGLGGVAGYAMLTATYSEQVAVGYHYLAPLEAGAGAAFTFLGDGGTTPGAATAFQCGMRGTFWA